MSIRYAAVSKRTTGQIVGKILNSDLDNARRNILGRCAKRMHTNLEAADPEFKGGFADQRLEGIMNEVARLWPDATGPARRRFIEWLYAEDQKLRPVMAEQEK